MSLSLRFFLFFLSFLIFLKTRCISKLDFRLFFYRYCTKRSDGTFTCEVALLNNNNDS